MTNGLLIYGEIFAHLFLFPHILGSPSSYIWLCNCSTLNFLIYEENLIFFFISVPSTGREIKLSEKKGRCGIISFLTDIISRVLSKATLGCELLKSNHSLLDLIVSIYKYIFDVIYICILGKVMCKYSILFNSFMLPFCFNIPTQ